MKDIKKVLSEENVFNLDFDKETFRCDECSRELRHDEGTVASGGMVYCDECAKDLHRCASCGCWVTEDDPHGLEYDYYCEDCAENFARCEYCDSVIDDEEYLVEYSGDSSYCWFCFEEALGGFVCAGCGNECSEYDGGEGEDGEYYCNNCLEERENNTWR